MIIDWALRLLLGSWALTTTLVAVYAIVRCVQDSLATRRTLAEIRSLPEYDGCDH